MTFCVHIDEGHGGHNLGTEAAGIPEKDLTLAVGELLADMIRASMPVRLSRSRSHDTDLSQYERGAISVRREASLVLSIHINAQPGDGGDWHGAEAYHMPGNFRSQHLAETWIDALPRIVKPARIVAAIDADPDHRNARAILLAHVADVVLCELCYATNETDRAWILSPQGRVSAACSLLAVVVEAWRLQEGMSSGV